MGEETPHGEERLGQTGGDRRTPIATALPLAESMGLQLYGPSYVERVHVCGSVRRFRETVGDINLVVASVQPSAVTQRFVDLPGVKEITSRGETRTSVLVEGGLHVDLRVVTPDRFGGAYQYLTGSRAHNLKLRTLARKRGWLLNELGLTESDTGKVVASDTEEAIYEALGLELMPAPMREDCGEVELALEGRLPRSVRHENVRGDLRLHTPLPDTTRGTVSDLVSVAADKGYTYLALVDPSGGNVSRRKLEHQQHEIAALRKDFPHLTLLHGAQIDIAPDGSLEGDPACYRELDWCTASVRSDFDLDASKQTKRILTAMEDPSVNAIAHLTGRQFGARPGMQLDLDAVFQKAVETGTAIEITAQLGRLDPPGDTLLRARDLEVTFVLASEARTPSELGHMRWCVRQAQRGWVSPERIANCWPHKQFLAWLESRR